MTDSEKKKKIDYIKEALAEKICEESPSLAGKRTADSSEVHDVIWNWDPDRTFVSVKEVHLEAVKRFNEDDRSETAAAREDEDADNSPHESYVANTIRDIRETKKNAVRWILDYASVHKLNVDEVESLEVRGKPYDVWQGKQSGLIEEELALIWSYAVKKALEQLFNSDREQEMLEAAGRLLDAAGSVEKAGKALVKVIASIPQRKRPKPLLIFVRRALVDLLVERELVGPLDRKQRAALQEQDDGRVDEVLSDVIKRWNPWEDEISLRDIEVHAQELFRQRQKNKGEEQEKGEKEGSPTPSYPYVCKVISEIKANKNDHEKRMTSAARDLLDKSGNSFDRASGALFKCRPRSGENAAG